MKEVKKQHSAPLGLWNVGLALAVAFFVYVLFLSIQGIADSSGSSDSKQEMNPSLPEVIKEEVQIVRTAPIKHPAEVKKATTNRFPVLSPVEARKMIRIQEEDLLNQNRKTGGKYGPSEEEIREMSEKGIMIY